MSSNAPRPVAQLESLKYRITQIMESITMLQFLIDSNSQPVMPPWPDILARYNLLLSQTHSLSVSLSSTPTHHQFSQPQSGQPGSSANPLQELALHPSMVITEQQLDHALAPLLRNQPTIQAIKDEDAYVRRIAAVLKTDTPDGPERFEQVVQECTDMRSAHDARVERAVKAVALLRERYDWHARVEPEDLTKEQVDLEPDRETEDAQEAEDALGQVTTPDNVLV